MEDLVCGGLHYMIGFARFYLAVIGRPGWNGCISSSVRNRQNAITKAGKIFFPALIIIKNVAGISNI